MKGREKRGEKERKRKERERRGKSGMEKRDKLYIIQTYLCKAHWHKSHVVSTQHRVKQNL